MCFLWIALVADVCPSSLTRINNQCFAVSTGYALVHSGLPASQQSGSIFLSGIVKGISFCFLKTLEYFSQQLQSDIFTSDLTNFSKVLLPSVLKISFPLSIGKKKHIFSNLCLAMFLLWHVLCFKTVLLFNIYSLCLKNFLSAQYRK